jgi:hypothetical protein
MLTVRGLSMNLAMECHGSALTYPSWSHLLAKAFSVHDIVSTTVIVVEKRTGIHHNQG